MSTGQIEAPRSLVRHPGPPVARAGKGGEAGERPRADPRTTPRNESRMTPATSTWTTKKGLAQMLKGGVIMDVVTPEHARIAEDAGAVAVMALERVPADIRAHGGEIGRAHV